MGGIIGVANGRGCVLDVFYGTDYHSHLGTMYGGLAYVDGRGFFHPSIHSIANTPFRTRFESELPKMRGRMGIGAISDTDPQPLVVTSHLGTFALATVGALRNQPALVRPAMRRGIHFQVGHRGIAQTEVVAALINQGSTIEDGIRIAQEKIRGSCSLLVMTKKGIYAARDRLGRTPLVLGQKPGAHAVTMETCAFPNLGFEIERDLGPGEIVRLTPDGVEQLQAPGETEQICSFLWVYYGFPASSYLGINVEQTRNRCGAALAGRDSTLVDFVAGIPDSGTGHALGYSNVRNLPYKRPFVKYTPTWPRSFMPQDPEMRRLVARMKLIPIPKIIAGQRLLFGEDSIVRGTQLKDTIKLLFQYGAREVHMRPACPPLIYGCPFLNFSRSRSELDLAGRRALLQIGGPKANPADFVDPDTEQHAAMVDVVRSDLGLTTLQYQTLPDLVSAIGLPKCRLCTHCWDGSGCGA